jgi:intracellular sulfur oxidation DsrE/DsrF family protein
MNKVRRQSQIGTAVLAAKNACGEEHAMNRTWLKCAAAVGVVAICEAMSFAAPWPEPKAPVISDADGYVTIPHAAVPPDPSHIYRAVYDATRAAGKPSELLPAINMAGSELNALGASGVPLRNARFALVFHGDALAGILDEAHYKAKFGVSNPNLRAIAEMKKAGVEMFVCGQNLAFEKIDPRTLTPDVTIASDALLVLMTYQNKGYALLSF